MNPTHSTSQQLSLGDRTSGAGSTPEAINYAYLHRGSIVMATAVGVVLRLELYQRRSFDALSLRN